MIIQFSIAASLLALLFAGYLAKRIYSLKTGDKKMKEIADAIHEGAMAFLNREYKTLVVFALVVSAVLYIFVDPRISVAFLIGAFCSALAGNLGMRIATAANVRTAHAVHKSLTEGLKTAFSSGLVMGLCVVGLGVLGVSVLYLVFGDPNILFGFGFGASSIALFARVGGGIYTKGADVGADLVGKVEAGIPEDDPRNPATIADNVGDNVGDVAGMGADLFESYVDSIIATMALGVVLTGLTGAHVLLPLAIAATGIIASIIGSFLVGGKEDPQKQMNKGIMSAAVLTAVASYFVVSYVLGPGNIGIYVAVLAGLVSGVIIGYVTEYYTSDKYEPTQSISHAAETGAGTNIIAGLSIGMFSTVIPVLAVSAAILVAFIMAGGLINPAYGMYGISLAAVGMLATLGITLAADSYGPVADNAAGIAEMAGMGGEVRKRAEELDAVGNTTAAIGKGFAIGSAALTALALYVTFATATGLKSIDVLQPKVTVGLFIGGLLPFLFSSFAMSAVGKAAEQMVEEVRRQFREIKGLMQGKAKPDYERCVKISTGAAIHAMVEPAVIAVVSPILIGLLLGSEALGGMLAGTVVTGFLLAVMMSNAGGAWDNAKKYI
ncbi:MAG: sodium-translocating pyrophosphatase, partial [Candidatus Altiarchaeota archaeon]|nr:sodium-translocating pyrophosphatase [Candidatus Altiarchaeota archaeon]